MPQHPLPHSLPGSWGREISSLHRAWGRQREACGGRRGEEGGAGPTTEDEKKILDSSEHTWVCFLLLLS